jgi:thiamine kinase-like enzyme
MNTIVICSLNMDFVATGIKRFPKPCVFIHNDLQFHNLLASPESKRLSGIDWTDACIAPLAREFAINELMQGNLLQQAIEIYRKRTGVHIDKEQAIILRSIRSLLLNQLRSTG